MINMTDEWTAAARIVRIIVTVLALYWGFKAGYKKYKENSEEKNVKQSEK